MSSVETASLTETKTAPPVSEDWLSLGIGLRKCQRGDKNKKLSVFNAPSHGTTFFSERTRGKSVLGRGRSSGTCPVDGNARLLQIPFTPGRSPTRG